jgi:hypothetical protein
MWLSNRFRLPTFTLLGATEEKERRLITAANATLGSIYAELALCLPESEVRLLFRSFANGKRGKRSNDDRDRGLLAAMDAAGPRSSSSKLAKHLYQQDSKRWGASADAIEKHLQRLRRERKRRRDASDAATLRWRKAIGSRTSLLNDPI